jgi:hypothetical protein
MSFVGYGGELHHGPPLHFNADLRFFFVYRTLRVALSILHQEISKSELPALFLPTVPFFSIMSAPPADEADDGWTTVVAAPRSRAREDQRKRDESARALAARKAAAKPGRSTNFKKSRQEKRGRHTIAKPPTPSKFPKPPEKTVPSTKNPDPPQKPALPGPLFLVYTNPPSRTPPRPFPIYLQQRNKPRALAQATPPRSAQPRTAQGSNRP